MECALYEDGISNAWDTLYGLRCCWGCGVCEGEKDGGPSLRSSVTRGWATERHHSALNTIADGQLSS